MKVLKYNLQNNQTRKNKSPAQEYAKLRTSHRIVFGRDQTAKAFAVGDK